MKKLLFSIFVLALSACSNPTTEEQVQQIVENDIKSLLLKPESFSLIQFQMDSCFLDDVTTPRSLNFNIELAELFSQYMENKSEADDAESFMSIYTPINSYTSEHAKTEYKQYKAKMEKAQQKADDVKAKIIDLYVQNKEWLKTQGQEPHDHCGMRAYVTYKAQAQGGMTIASDYLYFFDKDLNIVYRISSSDMSESKTKMLQDIKYELGEDLTKALLDE